MYCACRVRVMMRRSSLCAEDSKDLIVRLRVFSTFRHTEDGYAGPVVRAYGPVGDLEDLSISPYSGESDHWTVACGTAGSTVLVNGTVRAVGGAGASSSHDGIVVGARNVPWSAAEVRF